MPDAIHDELEYQHLESQLGIDKYALDDEVIHQPKLFSEVARKSARAAAILVEAKDNVKVVEGRLIARVRGDAEANNERLTDAAAKAKMECHPERIAAVKAFANATEDAEKWSGLKESYSNRAFLIRDLCNLWQSGYFQKSSVSTGGAQSASSYDRNRAELARARQNLQNAAGTTTTSADEPRVRISTPPDPLA